MNPRPIGNAHGKASDAEPGVLALLAPKDELEAGGGLPLPLV